MSKTAVSSEDSVVVYIARRFLTMDENMPSAEAVAVCNGRIVGVGSLQAVVAELGDVPYRVDDCFADRFVLPGLKVQRC